MAIPLPQQIDAMEAGILGMRHWLEIQQGRPAKEQATWENSIRGTKQRIEEYEAVIATLRWLQANEPTIREAIAAKRAA